jgi:hypothetical protein
MRMNDKPTILAVHLSSAFKMGGLTEFMAAFG